MLRARRRLSEGHGEIAAVVRGFFAFRRGETSHPRSLCRAAAGTTRPSPTRAAISFSPVQRPPRAGRDHGSKRGDHAGGERLAAVCRGGAAVLARGKSRRWAGDFHLSGAGARGWGLWLVNFPEQLGGRE